MNLLHLNYITPIKSSLNVINETNIVYLLWVLGPELPYLLPTLEENLMEEITRKTHEQY